MSEQLKVPTAKVIDNSVKALEYLSSLEKEALSRVGKPGFNPFIWIRSVLRPLEQKIKGGDKSDSTIALVMNLKVPEKTQDVVREVDVPNNR